jgi:D-alanyl-D-alanine carboxypeptidase (penicillin-binding protein 5/6)
LPILILVIALPLGWWGWSALDGPGGSRPGGLPALANGAVGPTLDSLSLNSTSAYLTRFGQPDAPLLDQAGDQAMSPGSLVKMMTAVVVLAADLPLDRTITLSADIFNQAAELDLTTSGFEPGEMVNVRDLLYGMMLPSGADCAIGLAEAVAGDEASFADLMNDQAAELGMTGSHFTNASGAYDPDLYLTAHDMVTLLNHALTIPEFASIFTAHGHTSAPTNLHPDGVSVTSTFFQADNGQGDGFAIIGAKTGYTTTAGQSLASLAEVDGQRYLLVTAGAATTDNLHDLRHINDARLIYSAI